MGSWLGYTVYPVDGVSNENLRETLRDTLGSTVMDVCYQDDPERVSPWIIEEYGGVGARISTSPTRIHDGDRVVGPSTVEWGTLREAVVKWLEQCAEHIAVTFIIMLHDTSDAGILYGYRSEDDRLREVRSEEFSYRCYRTKGSDFESGARLHPSDSYGNEINREIDYLVEFKEEFGYRPVTFHI